MTKLRVPVTLAELQQDETYAIYLSRKPKVALARGGPAWMLLAQTHKGKWLRQMEDDYHTALEKLEYLQAKKKVRDVCLFSRQKFFRQPSWFEAAFPFSTWCVRCRRPTLFQIHYGDTHHALPGATLYQYDVKRCFFCGITQEFNSFSLGRK